jgi:ATP-dependent Clp protease adaptor protein ClpS
MKDSGDNQDGNGNGTGNTGTGIVTKTRPKTKKPSLYKVLLLNDDYTPMEFVVHILEKIFGKSREEAVDVMLHVHRHGVGICGIFTFEVAETKVAQVIEFSRRHQHPLQCTMEKSRCHHYRGVWNRRCIMPSSSPATGITNMRPWNICFWR